MGLLSALKNIGSSIIKNVIPAAVKAIAPAASGLLKGVVGDLFQKGAGFIGNALKALPLPNAIKALGEKLLGKGVEKLTQLAGGGIDALVKKLSDMVLKRFAPEAGNVAPPSISTSPERQTQIGTNNPAPSTGSTGGTGSNTGAATGGAQAPAGKADGSQFGWSGGPPSPQGRNMEDPNVAAQFQREMMAYQNAMNNMKLMMETLSNAFKTQNEISSTISRNIR